MRPFAALERFFERLFERPSARLFHARLQPIQLQRRVERAMENGRLSASDRVVVPNRYLVRMAPIDLRAFGDFADSLELELADAALKFARAHRYAVSDRPAVRLYADASVAEGDAEVDATFSDAPFASVPPPPEPPMIPVVRDARAEAPIAARRGTPAVGAEPAAPLVASVQPGDGPPPAPRGIRAEGRPRASSVGDPIPDPAIAAAASVAAASVAASPGAAVGPSVAPPSSVRAAPTPAPPPLHTSGTPAPLRPGTSAGLARLDPTRTMVFEVPRADAPVVVLREVGPDGSQRELTLDGGPVTIGRATDNNLVLRDSRVSRYHGRLAPRQGALVYRDLGSTNGSRVNGVEIDEVVLGAGDRIEIGDTVLVVESVAGA